LQYKQFKTTFFELDGGEQIRETITRQTRNMQTLIQHQKEHVKNGMQHDFSKDTHCLAPLVIMHGHPS
jgi:hypothetical protein